MTPLSAVGLTGTKQSSPALCVLRSLGSTWAARVAAAASGVATAADHKVPYSVEATQVALDYCYCGAIAIPPAVAVEVYAVTPSPPKATAAPAACGRHHCAGCLRYGCVLAFGRLDFARHYKVATLADAAAAMIKEQMSVANVCFFFRAVSPPACLPPACSSC